MPEFEDSCEACQSSKPSTAHGTSNFSAEPTMRRVTDLDYRKSECQPLVLVVDDNEVQRALMGWLAERLKVHAYIVGSCKEAEELAEFFCFDIILMDIRMPEEDGFKCSKRLREIDGKKGRRTPILAITADAMPGNVEKMKHSSELDDYLLRPFTMTELEDKLCHWVRYKVEPPKSDSKDA